MPFTLAHPFSVLPFKWIRKDFFSTTGLVVGSMAPDYEYFMKQQPSPTVSETLWGSLLFNLPMAIIVALVFHLLVKRPLVQHLPHPYDRRLSGYACTNFLTHLGKSWHLFFLSTLIGIGSHHLLDWTTNPAMGPFGNTGLTEYMTIGSIQNRPLILMERVFEVIALSMLAILLFRANNPAAGFIRADKTLKVIFWTILCLGSSLLVLWEWFEVGGISSFAKGITTLLWATSVSLVTCSVMIHLFKRLRLVR